MLTHGLQFLFNFFFYPMQESADNVNADSDSPSKDALLEEACNKYDEATHLCPTLHDVCTEIYAFKIYEATPLCPNTSLAPCCGARQVVCIVQGPLSKPFIPDNSRKKKKKWKSRNLFVYLIKPLEVDDLYLGHNMNFIFDFLFW